MSPYLLPILSFILGLCGFLLAIDTRRKSGIQEIESIRRDVALLKLQVDVFWKGVSFNSAQTLHSPHTPELDRLIEKFQRDEITDSELYEFKRRLREVQSDASETPLRRKAAGEVLTLIKVRYEVAAKVV